MKMKLHFGENIQFSKAKYGYLHDQMSTISWFVSSDGAIDLLKYIPDSIDMMSWYLTSAQNVKICDLIDPQT